METINCNGCGIELAQRTDQNTGEVIIDNGMRKYSSNTATAHQMSHCDDCVTHKADPQPNVSANEAWAQQAQQEQPDTQPQTQPQESQDNPFADATDEQLQAEMDRRKGASNEEGSEV